MKIIIQKISRIAEGGMDRLDIVASAAGFNVAAQFVVVENVKTDSPIPDDIKARVEKRIHKFLDEIERD